MRKITNDDLWSAIRGLGMYSMSANELVALTEDHSTNKLFASQVIAAAAYQVIAARRLVSP
jgi:hypothetical protein